MLHTFAAVAVAILQLSLSAEDIDRLVAASAKAITAPDGEIRGNALGKFETPLGEAEAFKTDFTQGFFRRRYVVLIHPKDPAQGPASVMLTSNTAVDQMSQSRGEPPTLFVDLYTCNMHSTLSMLPAEPSFDEFRALVVDRLQNMASAASSTQAQGGGDCGYGGYVFPGLGQRRDMVRPPPGVDPSE